MRLVILKRSSNQLFSMMPLVLPGDQVIVSKKDKIRIDDVVVFKRRKRLIAHRVIFLSPDRKTIITKGDNNKKADKKISVDEILGKVEKIKRNGSLVYLKHLYLTQSSSYFEELTKIINNFEKRKVNHILLKGLPLYLSLFGRPPRRLYLDADILIRKKDLSRARKVLDDLGFKEKKQRLFGQPVQDSSQIVFLKDKKPFPVVIDLHLEASVGFTKNKELNKLGPDCRKLTDFLFTNKKEVVLGNLKYQILKKEVLLVFLLLHFYHHNFNGPHRINLIAKIIKRGNVNWDKIVQASKALDLINYLYTSLLFVNYLYGNLVPPRILKELKPKSIFKRFFAWISLILFKPLDEEKTGTKERIKRLIFLFLFSSKNINQRIKILFNKESVSIFYRFIRPAFLNSSRNSS